METMYARRNDDGVSVNESALCYFCMHDAFALMCSYEAWRDAEDVTQGIARFKLFPVDNPDALCSNCGIDVKGAKIRFEPVEGD